MALNQSAERIRYDEVADIQNSTSVIARSNQSQPSSVQASNSQLHYNFNKKEEINQSFHHVECRHINNASNQNNLISNVFNQKSLISNASNQNNLIKEVYRKISVSPATQQLNKISRKEDARSQEKTRVILENIEDQSEDGDRWSSSQEFKAFSDKKRVDLKPIIQQVSNNSHHLLVKQNRKDSHLYHEQNLVPTIIIDQYHSPSQSTIGIVKGKELLHQSNFQSDNQFSSQSNKQSISQSINQSTSQSINQSTSQLINKSTSQSNFQSASLSNYQSVSQSNYQSASQSAAQSSYHLTNQSNNQLINQSNNQSYQLNSNFNSVSEASQNAKYSNFSEESQKNIREHKVNESSSSGFRSYQRDELAVEMPQKTRRASTNLPININIQREHGMQQGNKFRILISPTPESDRNMENYVPADDQFNTFPRRRSSVSIVPKSIDEQYSLNEQYKRRASLHPERVSESRTRDQPTREELRQIELSKLKNINQNNLRGRNQRTENEVRYEETNKRNYEKENRNKITEQVIPSKNSIQKNQEKRFEKKIENYQLEDVQSEKEYQEFNYRNKDIRSHINIKNDTFNDKFNEQMNKEQVRNESVRRHDQQIINNSKEMNSKRVKKYSYETESRSQRNQNLQNSQVSYISNASSNNQTLSHQIVSGTSLSAIDYKQNISNQNTGYYKIETGHDGRRFSNPNSILRRSDDSSSQSTISEGIQSHDQKEFRSKSWNGESSSQTQKVQKQLNVSFEQQQVEQQQKKYSMLQHISEHQDTFRRTNSQTSFDDLYNYENLQHEKKSKRAQRSLSFSGRKISTRNQVLNSNLNNEQYTKNQSAHHQDSSSLKILSGSHVGEISNEFKKVSKLDIKTTSIKNTKSTSSSSQSSTKINLHKDEQKDYFGSVNVSAKNGIIMLVMDENDLITEDSKSSERYLLNDSTFSSEKNYLKEEEQQSFYRSKHHRRKSDGDALLAQTKAINKNYLNHSYEELHSIVNTRMIPMETVYYTVCTRFFMPENDDWIVNIHRMGTFNASVGSNHSDRCVFWNQLFNQDNEDILVQKLVPPENFQNNDFSTNDRTIVGDQSQYLNNRGINIRNQSEGDFQLKSSSTKKKRKFSLLKKPHGELEGRNINPMFC